MKVASIAFIVTFVAVAGFAGVASGEPGRAKSAPIARMIDGYLAEKDGYQPGDILSRVEVKDVLIYLKKQGVVIVDADSLLARCLGADSLLLELWGTNRGQRFLRRVGKIPGGYSRLDRLSQLPKGKELVRILERDPGGDKLIEYLATTSGGQELGRMLSKPSDWVNPNQPTDRIYTAEDLVAALEKPAKDRGAGQSQPKVTRQP